MSRCRGSTRLALFEEQFQRRNSPVRRPEFLAPNLGKRTLCGQDRGARALSRRDEANDGTIAIGDFDFITFLDGAKMLGQVVLQLGDPHSFHGQIWPCSVRRVKAVPSSTESRPSVSLPLRRSEKLPSDLRSPAARKLSRDLPSPATGCGCSELVCEPSKLPPEFVVQPAVVISSCRNVLVGRR